jgi:hypothetical protein
VHNCLSHPVVALVAVITVVAFVAVVAFVFWVSSNSPNIFSKWDNHFFLIYAKIKTNVSIIQNQHLYARVYKVIINI